jgi:hypothetical protein
MAMGLIRPGRKASNLTGEEMAFIIANHKTMYVGEMAKALSRDRDTVSRYLKYRGWKAKKQVVVSSKLVPEGGVVMFKRNGAEMFYVKRSGKFRLLHHDIWEQMYGDIPPGYVISFKDHNSLNVDPSNLVIVSRKKWMLINSINEYPKEIRELIILSSRLKHSINEQQPKSSEGSAVCRTEITERSGDQRQPTVA